MKKPASPCYKCEDRTPGCHGECEAWSEYQAQAEKYKANLYANKHKAHAGIAPFSQMKETYKRNRRNIK